MASSRRADKIDPSLFPEVPEDLKDFPELKVDAKKVRQSDEPDRAIPCAMRCTVRGSVFASHLLLAGIGRSVPAASNAQRRVQGSDQASVPSLFS